MRTITLELGTIASNIDQEEIMFIYRGRNDFIWANKCARKQFCSPTSEILTPFGIIVAGMRTPLKPLSTMVHRVLGPVLVNDLQIPPLRKSRSNFLV